MTRLIGAGRSITTSMQYDILQMYLTTILVITPMYNSRTSSAAVFSISLMLQAIGVEGVRFSNPNAQTKSLRVFKLGFGHWDVKDITANSTTLGRYARFWGVGRMSGLHRETTEMPLIPEEGVAAGCNMKPLGASCFEL